MAQIIVAVTNIKHDDVKIAAGDPVPVDKFTKEDLIKLYELGAIDKVDALPSKEEPGLSDGDLAVAGTNVAKVDEEGKLLPRTETPAQVPTEAPKTEEPVTPTEPAKPEAVATPTKTPSTPTESKTETK